MRRGRTNALGRSSIVRIKAPHAELVRQLGKRAADAWLAAIHLVPGDLDDETREVPLALVEQALEQFEELSPGGIERCAEALVSPDHLGAWAQLLRAASAPDAAMSVWCTNMASAGSAYAWTRLERGPNAFAATLVAGPDEGAVLSQEAPLVRWFSTELRAVAALYGARSSLVTRRTLSDGGVSVNVVWSYGPGELTSGAIGASVGAAVCSLVAMLWLASITVLGRSAFVGSGLALGWVTGHLVARAARAKSLARAQQLRMTALERFVALREHDRRTSSQGLEGKIIAGTYRLRQPMGSGATGVIYEAVRLTDGRPCAVKLLRAVMAHDATASDRLRRESEALGLSWHPNVIELLDHGQLGDGTAYLVVERLTGETLASRLRSERRLSPESIGAIGLQLCEALTAIHAAGVVHRDLKPDNLYLVPDPSAKGGERVKVFDFGIARVEWEEMRITHLGAPIGTPGYMSPEQEAGLEVDHRSDIYSAGALLYECFVGEPPPFSKERYWQLGGYRISHPSMRALGYDAPGAEPPTPLVTIEVLPGWQRLIEQALATRPEERFADAREMLAAIKQLVPAELLSNVPPAVAP